MLIKRLQQNYFIIWMRNYIFLKNYVTSEGAVSYNVWYYQQLSIARYQVLVFMLTIMLSNYQAVPF